MNDVLAPVYDALGLDWDPAATGSVRTEAPTASWDAVADALVTEYARDYDIEEAGELDPETLALAHELADEHRVR